MNPSIIPSERAPLVGVIDPQSATTAKSTGWIKCDQSILFTLLVGALATSATVDAKVEEAKDASGTSPQDISGKAITQLTQAGTDSDKQAVIELFANDLDINNGFTHVRLSMTVGTATSDAGGIVLGLDPVIDVASANDAATVDEIV